VHLTAATAATIATSAADAACAARSCVNFAFANAKRKPSAALAASTWSTAALSAAERAAAANRCVSAFASTLLSAATAAFLSCTPQSCSSFCFPALFRAATCTCRRVARAAHPRRSMTRAVHEVLNARDVMTATASTASDRHSRAEERKRS